MRSTDAFGGRGGACPFILSFCLITIAECYLKGDAVHF